MIGIILAAGQGRRMHSKTPKPLHQVCGVPMLEHVSMAMRGAGIGRLVAVSAPDTEADPGFIKAAGPDAAVAVQQWVDGKPRGTADAVRCAQVHCHGGKVAVVGAGDMPLITAETIRTLVQRHRESKAVVTVLTAMDAPVAGLGRVIREPQGTGRPVAIVEEQDATEQQGQVKEVNTSWYCFDAAWMWQALERVTPSKASGEMYLTDLVEMAVREGRHTAAISVADPIEALGVNDRVQLARAEAAMRLRTCKLLMLGGVTVIDPAATYIDANVRVGQDTVIQPGVHLRGRTLIGAGCRIGPGSVITDSQISSDCEVGPNSIVANCEIGPNSKVVASFCDGAKVGSNVSIGPFSRLRQGAVIGDRTRIGNYAEVKNSKIAEDVHISHFSYTGDATVGRGVNIGAGTITCNFDSESGEHSMTEIGDGASLGSGTMLIAPRKVGRDAVTGAGSVVTKDIPDGEVWAGNPARPLRKRSVKSRQSSENPNTKKIG
ncbi:MAG: bifunctional UDP-N-acetylglucosamine diphosphorylase/glucosamine-1-phosphate N-acetyltransferase GlmU [Dehalococcoidia bacterium]|nr:bifunctional UDP-N-acetylglucosamine diphosphorylase/glucosamine-1-phosphate N-acetyltransferase GlmU [Dehalococcoidia bacterium]MSQ34895.1 bifunctional UDP-N-acetylglucosamine diphosphorylase/glucosamine-1-phosphate N-acetyltransferase GlmU [Dehalococcoidia bacterium]